MPSQFWELTPAEFALQVAGFAWRQEQEQYRMANIVAAIYNVNRDPKRRRRPITAEDLIGRKRRAPGAQTPEAQLKALTRLTEMLGGTIRRG